MQMTVDHPLRACARIR